MISLRRVQSISSILYNLRYCICFPHPLQPLHSSLLVYSTVPKFQVIPYHQLQTNDFTLTSLLFWWRMIPPCKSSLIYWIIFFISLTHFPLLFLNGATKDHDIQLYCSEWILMFASSRALSDRFSPSFSLSPDGAFLLVGGGAACSWTSLVSVSFWDMFDFRWHFQWFPVAANFCLLLLVTATWFLFIQLRGYILYYLLFYFWGRDDLLLIRYECDRTWHLLIEFVLARLNFF